MLPLKSRSNPLAVVEESQQQSSPVNMTGMTLGKLVQEEHSDMHFTCTSYLSLLGSNRGVEGSEIVVLSK